LDGSVRSRFCLEEFSSQKPARSQVRVIVSEAECDWLVMSSALDASQSNCLFLCSREQVEFV
jgi:hypothetical protein